MHSEGVTSIGINCTLLAPADWRPGEMVKESERKVALFQGKEHREFFSPFYLLIPSVHSAQGHPYGRRWYRAEEWAVAWSPEIWVFSPNLLWTLDNSSPICGPLSLLGKWGSWTTEIILDGIYSHSIWSGHLCQYSMPVHALLLLCPSALGPTPRLRGTTYPGDVQQGSLWSLELSSCSENISKMTEYNLSRNLKMLGWMKHKLESRLPGEISITSDMQMIPPLWQKVKKN